MTGKGKPESSRLNLFFILQILEHYTDEEHPLSVSHIAEKVNAEFGYLSASNVLMSVDTVKRTLEELTDKIFLSGVDYEELTHRYGYYIYCVMKKDGKYVAYRSEDGKQPPKKYYYLEDDLKTAEILTLKDAVETYSYFSEEDITEIVRKLTSLRPTSFPKRRYIDIAKDERDDDSLLLMNIDALNDIIKHRNCARINYCTYNADKELVPRPGYPRVIEPLHLMWSNGYYYLLAYSDKYESIVSYRVDRITDVEEVDSKISHYAEKFNPVQYRHEHPVMYGGERTRFTLLCRDTGKNHIMNTIMDTFGRNARVKKADVEMVKKYVGCSSREEEVRGITWLCLTVDSTPGGMELWATQYCKDCIIVSPEEVRESVKQRLLSGVAYYKN